jgi:beta-galactosidase/beta-glucuronidase
LEYKLKYLLWEVNTESEVVVTVDHTMSSPSTSLVRVMIPCRTILTFKTNSSLAISSHVYLPSSIPSVPRIGITFGLANTYSNVEWCGLGPHEAYDDRKECCHFGMFSSTIEDLHTPYVVPSENGRRAAPR